MNANSAISALQTYFAWAPPWVFSLVVIAAALTLALGFYGVVVRMIRRRLGRKGQTFWRPFLIRSREPGRLALIILALSWAVHVAPLPGRQAALVQHGLLIAFIGLVGWTVLMAVDIGSALYMRRYRVDVSDNLLARKHLTQVRILRRAVGVLVVLLTIAGALMTVPGVRQLGVSLLAAGGAAGIIVGLALQPVLSNLMAGIQIALTQPIRIDDAVLIDGEFGNVEEINSTYVVVRLWDLRRLVVPLKFFLDQPFQNWTKESSELLGTVLLYVDYSVEVEPLRRKFEAIVKASPLWDGKVAKVQVTDARERTMEVRCLVSARNSGELFDLRVEVREKMIGYLQSEAPDALPRDRIEVYAPEAARSGAPDRPGQQRVQ